MSLRYLEVRRRIVGVIAILGSLLVVSVATAATSALSIEVTHRVLDSYDAAGGLVTELEVTITNTAPGDLYDLVLEFGLKSPPARGDKRNDEQLRVRTLHAGESVTVPHTVALHAPVPPGYPLFVTAHAIDVATQAIVEDAAISQSGPVSQRSPDVVGVLPVALLASSAPSLSASGETDLISQIDNAPVLSTDPNNESSLPSISADGRYVAFQSIASDFVSGDTNGRSDIFVRDRTTGETTRVSVDSAGAQSNNDSQYASISANGRYVAFSSHASNLVPGDTNDTVDVFAHDRQTGRTIRISVGRAGTESNGSSGVRTSMSANGRYIAFSSDASNLVSGDTNQATDVFVHDCTTGKLIRVSVDSTGAQGNGSSGAQAISANGRYIVFWSQASNLVSGDINNSADLFVHDRATGKTSWVSAAAANLGAPSISADGRYVAFVSSASNLVSDDTNDVHDVFVRDRTLAKTTRISVDSAGAQANHDSFESSISADGRHVAFYSYASNLVSGDTNGGGNPQLGADVFVHDRTTGETTRVSLDSAGAQGDGQSNYPPTISANGRYVAFSSDASNLVNGDTNGRADVFVRDRAAGETTRVQVEPHSTYGANAESDLGGQSVTADGRFVVFSSLASNLVSGGDTNQAADVFARDRTLGETTLISLTSAGARGDNASYDPSISANGRYVVFSSAASNLVPGDTNDTPDVFMRDLVTSETIRISVDSAGAQANRGSSDPSISADGRYVAFFSNATNLVSDDTNEGPDDFVRDLATGETTLVSVDSAGVQSNGAVSDSSISADGRYVAFSSNANNLVIDDTNNTDDIFVHDRSTGETTRVSLDSTGAEANGRSIQPSISADGRYVAFYTDATNLVVDDTNGQTDVFVHDLITGETTRVSVDSTGAQGNGLSSSASISIDGRYVAFSSQATNLVSDDTNNRHDVFVHDRTLGHTTRVSVDSAGAQANEGSFGPSISADGAFVAFTSDATNLTPSTPDLPLPRDVFLHELGPANSTPIADSESVSTEKNEGLSISLHATYAGGDPLSYAIFGSPSHGLLTGTPPEVVYTPDPDFSGFDSFAFTVNDGLGTSTPGTVVISVTSENDAP